MQRPIPWLWFALAAVLLLAPGLVGRLLLNVLEGVTLLLVMGPLLLAGAGVLAWQLAKRRLVTCPACGSVSLGQSACPACGYGFGAGEPGQAISSPTAEVEASGATIDVVARVVDDE